MSGITIVGLGPGTPEQMTVQAHRALDSAPEIWLRTRHHPVVAQLPAGAALHSFDEVYEQGESFEAVYRTIAEEIIALGRRPSGVVYAVPGHPWIAERTVQLIHTQADEAGVEIRVIPGLSFLEPVLAAIRVDPLDTPGLLLVDATVIARHYHPPLEPDHPALIAQLYNRQVAGDLKLGLLAVYPPDHWVTLVDGAGTAKERTVSLPLAELDHHREWGLLTSLYVPPLRTPSSLAHFQEIVAHLRSPKGCPWDREQTHQSLRAAMLEEAAEVIEALDADDPAALCEELGDLLLHIVMQAQIASEGGEFTMADIIAAASAKIVRRHPHVFGEVQIEGMADLYRNWEAIKREEKAARGREESSLFANIPRALPSLARGQKILKRAVKTGWSPPALPRAIASWEAAPDETHLGHVLLAVAAEAQGRGLDAEQALRLALRDVVEDVTRHQES